MSGWINREQQQQIEYLKSELAVLRELLGRGRILMSDDQRRRMAVVGNALGRSRLSELGSIFTPDTILRWHRRLVAANHSHPHKGAGRPKLPIEVETLAVRLAKENPSWGCDRIVGELKKLGITISDTSVENILRRNGVEPAPDRKSGTKWREFLAAHLECLAAIDFTSVEVWTPVGLKTFYLLFVMELKSRKVQYLGSTTHPNETWMLNTVETATTDGGILGGHLHASILLMDRDSKYTAKFHESLKTHGVEPHVLPPRSPNLNAYIERFMLSYKTECANRLIFFGRKMFHYATEQFLLHYHEVRPHQGLDNEPIIRFAKPPNKSEKIVANKRLGGLLKSYRRTAA